MGFGKSLKKFAKTLQPAKLIKNTIKSAGEINAAGFGAVAQGVQAFGGVVSAGTQIMRDNPELVGALGAATGFNTAGLVGQQATQAYDYGGGGGGGYAAPSGSAVPIWAWIVGGVVAVLGFVLILRK